ncbi:MAG: peroxide stress protein YaaA [Gammaproteobacteria bacterium]|nr:peroxide stress protein YaaA [Gammaproteobacteria bacterium]
MLVVISPAKKLDENCDLDVISKFTVPPYLESSKKIIKALRGYSADNLSKLMNTSEKISELNYNRNIKWSLPFNKSNSLQALLMFKGDVYKGISVKDFNKDDFLFAQKSLRILSGLYGILKPLDLIQPYRLEMGTQLQIGKYRNLYDFWGDEITNILNSDKNNDYLINLASVEYFKSINVDNLKSKLINVSFKEKRDGKYKIIAIYSKRARGLMSRYIIKNKIIDPKSLKKFNLEDYKFNKTLSSDSDLVFTR